MTDTVPPVLRSAVVARTRDEAFAIFTEEIGAWWPLPTHSVFQSEAGGVHFDQGRLLERATDGREVAWAEVLEWDSPQRLVLAWHPGREPRVAGRVEVTFTELDGGTRVDVRHEGWEAFGEDALARRRDYVGPSAWGHVLDHFADGAEERFDSADLAGLKAAYAAFFAEAQIGGFGPPPEGEWNALQTVAHVALNDLALTAVAHSLIHIGDPTLENEACQAVESLDKLIATMSGADELIAFGRRCAAQAVAALRRLNSQQLAREIPCHLTHAGEVVLDEAVPWGRIAVDIQAAQHLPGHTQQLRDLR